MKRMMLEDSYSNKSNHIEINKLSSGTYLNNSNSSLVVDYFFPKVVQETKEREASTTKVNNMLNQLLTISSTITNQMNPY